MPDIFVSTVPFGEIDPFPRKIIEEAGFSYLVNPLKRKLRPGEISQFLTGVKAVIAGTEEIGRDDIAKAADLRLIARVGIGLDNVDLCAARDYNIAVTYTPDAPSPAVAELTLGLLMNLVRDISVADREIRKRNWKRIMGRRIEDLTVGIIGVGRIGFRVIRMLAPLRCRILAHDIRPIPQLGPDTGVEWVDMERLLKESDVVSLHVPLKGDTLGLIARPQIELMKKDSYIINTSRGGIINEDDLHWALKSKRIAGAAIDVYQEEPYSGPLLELDNVLLTQHMGSCTNDCRLRMEKEAAQEAVRILKAQSLASPVPPEEYHIQESFRKMNKTKGK